LRRTTLTALALTAFLLAGCGGDDDPQGTPTGTPDSSSSDPTAPTETEPTQPAVEPAGGFLIDLDRIRMHAPDGWKRNDPMSTFLLQADDRKTGSSVSLSDLSAVSSTPIMGQAKIAVKHYPRAEIAEPVEIAGVEWYHITGREDRFSTVHLFGTIHNGSEAVIDFSLSDDIPEDEQQQIIDSVLASVEWK
jgi:hypothetical protein